MTENAVQKMERVCKTKVFVLAFCAGARGHQMKASKLCSSEMKDGGCLRSHCGSMQVLFK